MSLVTACINSFFYYPYLPIRGIYKSVQTYFRKVFLSKSHQRTAECFLFNLFRTNFHLISRLFGLLNLCSILESVLTHFILWSLSMPHGNIREPVIFRCFQGHRKRPVAWNGLIHGIVDMSELRDRLFSTYVKHSEKLTFLTPWHAHLLCVTWEGGG